MLGLFVPQRPFHGGNRHGLSGYFDVSVSQCDLPSPPAQSPAPIDVGVSCSAKRLLPQQRQGLAIQVLAGTETVSELARQHEVSRKFLYPQVHTAEKALSEAFAPSSRPDDVLFYLPVTKAWLRQLVLALVLICHSSYRGVVELLRDLFDFRISLGTVHYIVHSPVAHARRINQQYDLSSIRIGLLDEIFQAPAIPGGSVSTGSKLRNAASMNIGTILGLVTDAGLT